MQSLTALLLVPFMAFLIRIQASSSADTTSSPDTSSSPDTTTSADTTSSLDTTSSVDTTSLNEEVKNKMKELQKYLIDLGNEFQEFGNQLMKRSNVLKAIEEYRDVNESAKNTNCKGAELSADVDKIHLESFIKGCTDSLPLDQLAAFHGKVQFDKAKVEYIEYKLKENDETCVSNPTACEEFKKTALDYLSNILSAKKKTEYKNDVHNVLVHAMEHLQTCFTQKSDELLNNIQDSTNAITSCLSKLRF